MRTKRSLITIGIVLCLGMLLAQPQVLGAQIAKRGKNKEFTARDKQEAIGWVEQGLAWGLKNVRVTDQYVFYSSEDGKYNYGIALARVSWTKFSNEGDGRVMMARVTWQDYAHDNPEYVQRPYYRGGETKDEKLKAGLDFLAADARQQVKAQLESQLDGFKAQAKSWREASVKPAMPEAAREHQVLAEYAFKEKDTDKAIKEYSSALDIFPTWPEGQFNLATLAGEKKFYETAIFHMKEYLELVPESPDAQAAKDSVIIWKDKVSSIYAANADSDSPAQLKNAHLRTKY
jgi:tetratricopeptide (TPR) repeat protein